MSSDGSNVIAVVGRGIVAQAALATLETLGATVRSTSRSGDLKTAFDGARVVVCAAGPLRETAEPVLEAAIAARAHYVDVGGEQVTLRELHERYDADVRRAGLVAIPGAGVDCMLGDLAAAWVARALAGVPSDDELLVRAENDRFGAEHPLDEIATSYVYDDFALSAGSQRSLFHSVGEAALAWRAERWEPTRAGSIRRVNVAALGGERDAIAFGGGDAITVPRHIDARTIATYRSITRNTLAMRALSLFARAMPFVPRAASSVLAPSPIGPEETSRTRFAIVTQVRRGFDRAQLAITGTDAHATTGAIAAWCANALASRGPGPVGMRAPAEIFSGEPALKELARIAHLALEPSFS